MAAITLCPTLTSMPHAISMLPVYIWRNSLAFMHHTYRKFFELQPCKRFPKVISSVSVRIKISGVMHVGVSIINTEPAKVKILSLKWNYNVNSSSSKKDRI